MTIRGLVKCSPNKLHPIRFINFIMTCNFYLSYSDLITDSSNYFVQNYNPLGGNLYSHQCNMVPMKEVHFLLKFWTFKQRLSALPALPLGQQLEQALHLSLACKILPVVTAVLTRLVSLQKRSQSETGSDIYLQSNHNFEGIIDHPLGSCQGTDHQNAKRKAAREKAHEAEVLDSLTNRDEQHKK